jgi:2-hydroxy-6-oxonona-2,4-dienedioate hydrolase
MEGIRSLMARSEFLKGLRTAHIETGRYAFHHLERGSGRPVVLVHGGGVWLYSFRRIIPLLSPHFKVHAFDMPGHGFTVSRREPCRMDLDSMVSALREYTGAVGADRASFVAHSWGGGWVLAYALAYPGRVDRIFLMDSSGLDVPDASSWEILKIPLVGEAVMRFAIRSAVRRMLAMSYASASMVDEEMVREISLPFSMPRNRRALVGLCRNLSWKGLDGRLDRIRHPVMLAWGERDAFLDVSLTGRFRERIPRIGVRVLRGCGHSPHEEMPDVTAGLITGFLRG